MRKIIITLIAAVLFLPAFAQEQQVKEYAPKKGNFQASLLLGDKMYYSLSGLYLSPLNTLIGLEPTEFRFSENYLNSNANSIMNMIGVEFKYFVLDQLSVSFVGAGSVNSTPSREFQEGVNQGTAEGQPDYDYIEANLTTRLVGSLGVNYHFALPKERIQPYVGVQGTFQLAKIDAITPYTNDPAYFDGGVRTGQIFGWSPSLVVGIEYALTPGLLIGFEIKPVSYYYSGAELFASRGLSAMTGANHEFTFLAHPRFKIGFRF
ncbi:hypothetical protein LJB95_00730 [Paludibacteraceae bacterium OttesenSCG-928-F17]|nr:hypothetical protein [Paludibacteraceae bacterium OttesenSCG-928-F17]